MADQITKDGIQISTASEIANNIINGTANTQGLKDIFGNDTNFDQDSPDAQLVNIFAQAKRDLSELAVQIFNSFDPDQASGSVLDARVLYNGVIRKGGTYTQVPITIECSQEVTLRGVDNLLTEQEIKEAGVFTIQDYNGNIYYLMNSETFPAGTNESITFRAQYMGATQSLKNSIDQIVTPQRGVLSVNNPNPPLVIGVEQETDEQLKLRRSRAVGLGMLGSVEVMQASLRQIANVTDACVFENNTGTPTEDGIPSHSVWVIVRGGTEVDIANCIYLRLNAGCGMRGSTVVPIETIFGEEFDIKYDKAVKENLSIRITARPINGVDVIDPSILADHISYNYKFKIYEPVTATRVDYWCKDFNDNFEYSNIQISADPNTRGYGVMDEVIDLSQSSVLNNWKSVGYGCLNVTLDGTDTVQINGLDFTNITSVAEIAQVITEGFQNAGYGAYAELGSDGLLYIYSLKRGAGSSVLVNEMSGGSYDDLSGSAYFDTENMTYTTGTAQTQGYIQCNVMNESQITSLKAVSNGSFGITLNSGTTVQVTGLNFTSITSAADVATIVNNKLASMPNVNAYCEESGLNVYIYSSQYGANSSVIISQGNSGTNVVTSSLLIDPSTVGVQGTNGTNGTATTATLDVTDYTSVTRGALAINVNGENARVVSELNFSECTTVTEMATIINSACVVNGIKATVSATVDDEILFTSNIAGADSTVTFSQYNASYTDISSGNFLDRTSMSYVAGVSPNPASWDTLLFPASKKNYFEIESSYITVEVVDNE